MTDVDPFSRMSYAALLQYAADRFQQAARLEQGSLLSKRQFRLFELAMAELDRRRGAGVRDLLRRWSAAKWDSCAETPGRGAVPPASRPGHRS